jgi:hypothetical protein
LIIASFARLIKQIVCPPNSTHPKEVNDEQ